MQKIKNQKKSHAFDEALLHWRAPEYLHHEKSTLWYVIASTVGIFLIIYGLVTDGWTFSLAISVFAGSYYLFTRTPAPIVDIKLSKVGIKIGHHTFPYSHFKHFWIHYDPPFVKKLYFQPSSRFQPDIFVSLGDVSPSLVRETLGDYVDELNGKSEPFSDALVRLFRL